MRPKNLIYYYYYYLGFVDTSKTAENCRTGNWWCGNQIIIYHIASWVKKMNTGINRLSKSCCHLVQRDKGKTSRLEMYSEENHVL